MNKQLAREIINYCIDKDYKSFSKFYSKSEVMSAVRYIEHLKSATQDDLNRADVVYWKIALRVD